MNNWVQNKIDYLKLLLNHPLTKSHKFDVLKRWLSWQIRSRLTIGDIEIPFVNDTVLSVHHGMHGATLNIYVGLAEFNDMCFTAHFLRSDDRFLDIGSNAGVYTVLASGVCGSKTTSVEPIQKTFEALQKNVRLNRLGELVTMIQGAVGAETGNIKMTKDLDAMNHVEYDPQIDPSSVCEVPMFTLDVLARRKIPQLIKIDVEGFENNVVLGGRKTFSSNDLMCVILELNGSGKRYGFSDKDVSKLMITHGFLAYKYEPFKRDLSILGQMINYEGGNTIYVRQNLIDKVKERLVTASPITVNGIRI